MMLFPQLEEEMIGSTIEDLAISQLTERNLDYYENNKAFLAQVLHFDEPDSELLRQDNENI